MIEVNIKKKLHGANGLLDLHFDAKIQEGELVTIYGPSGAGKTSVVRMIAGLFNPDDGRIVMDQSVWFDKSEKLNMRPQLRNIGMVFQDYSLFPNMTVKENLEFALVKGQPRNIVDDLLQLTELDQLHNKKPVLLSGGQKQRVALARALVRQPKLLLLDEPLSALDFEMQSKLQDYILKMHQEFNLTTILISHDLLEVIKMSKRVLVLGDGEVKADGTPIEVLPLTRLKELMASGRAF